MSDHRTEQTVTNRLAGESSPYLLLHQHNPVDWYPWGEEALERARGEDKPIFLSVGYSTCYWCHVMERESFADPRVAAVMNRDFVNVKLDREERPDLDEVYMTATQILTGQGGWPNSLFLTPKLEPFFAGTYFPPDDAHGRPGFRHVLEDLAQAWKERRREVEEQAAEMAQAMRHYLEERARPGTEPPGPGACWRGVDSLARRFDRQWGGFGGAPKFPTPSNLFLLLEMAPERPDAGEMLAATLDAMARGGIYDQLAGGFHRYATDREWKVPHFEKMLYDNGLLLELYAREHARTGDPQAARVARETAAFLEREMTSPEGALWSAIDAETGGHEGAYYVWTRSEIEAVLGEEDAVFAAPLLGFAGPPFFEGDRYVLHAPELWEEVARRRRLDPEELLRELAGPRRRLLEARGKRPRPATDDKVLADWNGMAIAGLAVAGQLLGEPRFIAQAVRAAEVVLKEMRPGGGSPLMHVWRAGQARIPAFLADYAYLVRGLLALHDATGEARWLASAAELTDEQAERLADPEGGFFVAGATPDLLFRSKDPFDGATPAANAVAVLNLIELSERDAAGRRAHWRDQATAALKAFAPLVEQHPEAVRMLAIAARRYRGEVPAQVEAARERAPEAGPLAMLEKEAEQLVKLHLELGPEGGTEAPAQAEQAGPGGGAGGGGEISWRPFRLVLEVAPGWHLQANPPSESFLVPTTLAAQGSELRRVSYPAGDPLKVAFSSQPVASYQGRIELAGEIGAPAGRREPAAGGGARLLLTYQLCDDRRCLPPVTRSVNLS
ncbi:MAG TPA: DUF255 domain-containing protein [Thermoanaerobaculia bacterium]|nr:DUF255 domain-containing protein [Thermoanaerobaculia bacterium]